MNELGDGFYTAGGGDYNEERLLEEKMNPSPVCEICNKKMIKLLCGSTSGQLIWFQDGCPDRNDEKHKKKMGERILRTGLPVRRVRNEKGYSGIKIEGGKVGKIFANGKGFEAIWDRNGKKEIEKISKGWRTAKHLLIWGGDAWEALILIDAD